MPESHDAGQGPGGADEQGRQVERSDGWIDTPCGMQALISPRARTPRPRSVPVFVLCGGLGTRLSGVEARPKAVLPVAGLPFLRYMVGLLGAQGFQRYVLCLGHGADLVQAEFPGPEFLYSMEKEPMGTGGALAMAKRYAARVNLVVNGDSYAGASYPDLLAAHTLHGRLASRSATILAVHMDDCSDYGGLSLDGDGRVTGFREKGVAGPGWINAGAYVLGGRLMKDLPERNSSLETETLPELADSGRVRSVAGRFFFRDIGTPGRLELAREEFRAIRDRMADGNAAGRAGKRP